MCGQNAPRRAPLFPLVRFPTSAGALKARFCAALPQRLVSRLDLASYDANERGCVADAARVCLRVALGSVRSLRSFVAIESRAGRGCRIENHRSGILTMAGNWERMRRTTPAAARSAKSASTAALGFA